MSKNEELRTIGSIFSFLKERNPLVLASMMSNSEDKDIIRFYYDKWIADLMEEQFPEKTCRLCGSIILDNGTLQQTDSSGS